MLNQICSNHVPQQGWGQNRGLKFYIKVQCMCKNLRNELEGYIICKWFSVNIYKNLKENLKC